MSGKRQQQGRVTKGKTTVAAKAKPSAGKGSAPVAREAAARAVATAPAKGETKPDLKVEKGKTPDQIPAEQVTGRVKEHIASQSTVKNLKDQLAEGVKVEDDLLTSLQDKIRENIRLEMVIEIEENRGKAK